MCMRGLLLRETIGTWDKIIVCLQIKPYSLLFNGCMGKDVIYIKIQHKSHGGCSFLLGILILETWNVLKRKSWGLSTNTKTSGAYL